MEKIKDRCEDVLVSSLTVYELLVGANYVWKKYGDAREMLKVQDMLKFLTEVEVGSEVVRRAAETKAELMVGGKDVPELNEDEEFARFKDRVSLLKSLNTIKQTNL